MAALDPQLDIAWESVEPRSRHRALRRFLRNKLSIVGAVIVLFLVLMALFAPVLAPYPPLATHFSEAFKPPSATHLLGTDELGRDLLSRIIYGSRGSLGAGVLIVFVGVGIGVPIGLISGFYGGLLDEIIMRLVDAALAFPPLVLALAIAWILGPSLIHAVMAIGAVTIPQFARITRGQVLSIRSREFVEAARCLGASPWRIMLRHILLNSATPIIVVATLNIGTAILSVASLSFLGLGPPPPSPNWGSMLEDGSQYLNLAPWISFFPGLAIFLAVLGFSTLGDGLRDVFDPK
ncbi:ABC transporter permease [Sulfobacillus thermosulfidooxidans]|uniref:ABC transporter permease n=1 Tax=Sulfobacillus thermosulfidooxidans TaxID=28034 RepID=A0A1R0IKI2_SULTH|nr:ABC transporter permease [Sulfobacillus thermosulfidooxidans]OLZ10506.1 diguanylate cyclase [Sulfobacillus thermosulfidooxidans]OLZ14238.1 diguanylate cyclase [Sulfobacillus thermosulfidooxidans]OLZ18981.1 diguanylate cyclase [Sulfobacillus thermosulfidooxidans]PSR25378.1 MAG: ABC transporter permease [Sulfobacillus thermosulfidooxidans]